MTNRLRSSRTILLNMYLRKPDYNIKICYVCFNIKIAARVRMNKKNLSLSFLTYYASGEDNLNEENTYEAPIVAYPY